MSTLSSSPVVSIAHVSSRRYDEEFKLKAVRMVLEQNHSIQEVARMSECAPMSVRNRVTRFQQRDEHGQSPPLIVSDDGEKCESKVSSKRKKSSPVFLPVRIVDDPVEPQCDTDGRYEIVTQSGLTLRLPTGTTLDILAGLVRELESVHVERLVPPDLRGDRTGRHAKIVRRAFGHRQKSFSPESVERPPVRVHQPKPVANRFRRRFRVGMYISILNPMSFIATAAVANMFSWESKSRKFSMIFR
jgi:transposase-like protein